MPWLHISGGHWWLSSPVTPRVARGASVRWWQRPCEAGRVEWNCRAAPKVAFENRALLQAIPVKGDLFVLVRQPKKKGRAEKGVAKATSQALISGMCVSNHVYNIIQRMDVVNWLHGIHLRAFWWLGDSESVGVCRHRAGHRDPG